jgi:adenylate kinase family enzyme
MAHDTRSALSGPVTAAFFGISGSGKGTQCDMLEKFLKEKDPSRTIVRPEMGNLLRAFMETKTPLAEHVGHVLRTGGLVPSFMPIHLLTAYMNEHFSGVEHAILDGTCRRPDQSRAADDMMRLWGRDNLHAIVLTLSPESAKARLVARGRFDDAKDEAIQSRFAWYYEHVVPSIEELRERMWHVHEIDGEADIETVHQNILSALGLSE